MQQWQLHCDGKMYQVNTLTLHTSDLNNVIRRPHVATTAKEVTIAAS